jgi:hypothetical protein
MGMFSKNQNSIFIAVTALRDSIHYSFGAAIGYVPPGIGWIQIKGSRPKRYNLLLEITGIDARIRMKGVTNIIDIIF